MSNDAHESSASQSSASVSGSQPSSSRSARSNTTNQAQNAESSSASGSHRNNLPSASSTSGSKRSRNNNNVHNNHPSTSSSHHFGSSSVGSGSLWKRARRSISSISGSASGSLPLPRGFGSSLMPSGSDSHSHSPGSGDHSRCVYIAGAFKSGNADLLNYYRRYYGRHYPTSGPYSSAGHHYPSSSFPAGHHSSSVLCNSCLPPMIALNRARTINEPVMSLANSDKFNRANCNKCLYKNPDTLLELASKAVASSISFETVEKHSNRIPIPVQERIIFWSFPRDDSFLRLYSSISSILVRNKFSPSVEGELRSLSAAAQNAGQNQPFGATNDNNLLMNNGNNNNNGNFGNNPIMTNGQQRNRGFGFLHAPIGRPEVPFGRGFAAGNNGLSFENRAELEQQQLVSLFKAGDVILAKGTVKNVIQIGK